MALLLCCSGFFSASEPAILALNRLQRRSFKASKSLGRRLAAYLCEHPSELFATVLLGNNVVNILYFTIGVLFCERIHKEAGAGIASAAAFGIFAAVVIFGETFPKLFAINYSVQFAPLAAVPLYVTGKVLAPIRPLLDAVVRHTVRVFGSPPPERHLSAEEIQQLVQLGEEEGSVSSSERSLIEEIIELGEHRVRDIMVPRVDMTAVSLRAPIEELRKVAIACKREKIPVYDGDLDNVVGVVHTKDLFLGCPSSVRECLREPLFVPELARIESLLELLRAKGGTMGVVVDEYGGVVGVVWLNDVIAEIVGEVEEAPATPAVERVDDRTFLLAGNLNIKKWSELFGVDLGEYEPETVAGLITILLGRLPRVGDEVEYANLKLRVVEMERHRVKRIRLEVGNEH